MTFMATRDEAHRPGLIRTTRISYSLDEATCRVTRRVGTDPAIPIRGLLAEELRFVLFDPEPSLAGLGAPGFTFNRDAHPLFIKYQITCISEAVQSGNNAQHGAEERVTLVGAVPLFQRAEMTHHPYWEPSASERPEEPDR